MSKKSVPVLPVEIEVLEYKSLSDFGYSIAKQSDVVRAQGAYALDNIKNFLDGVSTEVRQELNVGFRQRASELPKYAPTEYAMVSGNLLPVSQLTGELPKERFTVSIASAYSYTQQEFGAMKESEPSKYAIIKDLRDRVNKYCSNRFSDLQAAARKVYAERNPETKTRAATLCFGDFVEKTLDGLKTRCKTAEARGNDPTASMKALDAAIIAFKVKLETTK